MLERICGWFGCKKSEGKVSSGWCFGHFPNFNKGEAPSGKKQDVAAENQELRKVIREMNVHIRKMLGAEVADKYKDY